jgi:3-oxoacyl-[acyl-carrier-protein] synthase-1
VSARAVIQSTGAVCAVGIGSEQTWASIRAGIARFSDSSVHDRWFESIRMAVLPEDALEPLLPPVDKIPFTPRSRRMLRLAAPALRQALKGFDGSPPPLFIGLPEGKREPAGLPDTAFIDALAQQSAAPFDKSATQLFPRGRAAALIALDAALRRMAEGRLEAAIVGGVDTYLDLGVLGELMMEKRILGPRVMDGFIPGEGAAFVLLTRSGGRNQPHPSIAVMAAGTAQDPGHRYGNQPAKGEGLSFAIERMVAALGQPPPVQTTFAGFNGENFGAKEWGVARIRHAELFAPSMKLEHPADCFGDTGAAMGALLLAVAHASLLNRQRPSPALVWASSDREDRASAFLDLLA